jgi:hypothetical protein
MERHGLNYRILYTCLQDRQIYYVLGIVHRDFDYDSNHPFSRRISDDYDALTGV